MANTDNPGGLPAPLVTNKTIPAAQLRTVTLAAGFDATGNFVQRALEHLRTIQGFGNLPAEFQADHHVSKASGGGVTVHLRQQFKSIPVFMASQVVRFTPAGNVDSTTGNALGIDEDKEVEIGVSPEDAVLAAAKHAASAGDSLLGEEDEFGNALDAPSVDLTGYAPKVIAAFTELTTRPTVLSPGPFAEPIKASLTWFPAAAGLTLGWEVLITMPQGAGQYRIIVDAQAGTVLYSQQLVHLLGAKGPVYRDAGPPNQRRNLTMPLPWSDYDAAFDTSALPAEVPAVPADWFQTGATETSGTYVRARLGDSGPALQGRVADGSLVFNPQGTDGDDQKVLNIFYHNSFLHDLFYLLGFREGDGSFALRGGSGSVGDPVDARAHSGTVWGTANMLTPPLGTSPTMNMGLVASTNRHTAFDADVVRHEYMHGVTNRLVGGPVNTQALETPQSKAMGEGWGDYLACTLSGKTTVGDWVTGKATGIRSAAYDDSYPGTFGQIGTGIYTGVHRVGEIWCAALTAMNRNLNAALTAPRGQRLALQLVVDALKLSPANPNMLDMRDAILQAFEHRQQGPQRLSDSEGQAALGGIWAAFARFGMGVHARSQGGDFGGITEDFTPGVAVPQPSGGGTQPEPEPEPQPQPEPGGTDSVSLSDSVSAQIPDNDPNGLRRSLRVSRAGTVAGVTLKAGISHPYAGDLVITLTAPGGQPVTIFNREFRETPDFELEVTSTGRLSGLVGAQAAGDWVLSVADMAEGDVGTLHDWSLTVEVRGGAAAQPAGFAGEDGGDDLGAQIRQLAALLQKLADRLGASG